MNPLIGRKAILVGIIAFAVMLLFVLVVIIQKRNVPAQPTTQQATQEPKTLSNVDEVALQKQLQDILAKGKDSDCMTLADERYQFACHDFFKIREKK